MKVYVEFDVKDGKEDLFQQALEKFDHLVAHDLTTGFRADTQQTMRSPLVSFAQAMEAKLRKNDHKTHWRDQPIEAHFKFMMLEIEEFKVALEFLSVAAARGELLDIANFAMINWDKMSLLDQDKSFEEQKKD